MAEEKDIHKIIRNRNAQKPKINKQEYLQLLNGPDPIGELLGRNFICDEDELKQQNIKLEDVTQIIFIDDRIEYRNEPFRNPTSASCKLENVKFIFSQNKGFEASINLEYCQECKYGLGFYRCTKESGIVYKDYEIKCPNCNVEFEELTIQNSGERKDKQGNLIPIHNPFSHNPQLNLQIEPDLCSKCHAKKISAINKTSALTDSWLNAFLKALAKRIYFGLKLWVLMFIVLMFPLPDTEMNDIGFIESLKILINGRNNKNYHISIVALISGFVLCLVIREEFILCVWKKYYYCFCHRKNLVPNIPLQIQSLEIYSRKQVSKYNCRLCSHLVTLIFTIIFLGGIVTICWNTKCLYEKNIDGITIAVIFLLKFFGICKIFMMTYNLYEPYKWRICIFTTLPTLKDRNNTPFPPEINNPQVYPEHYK